jgi:hypothetical protein
VVVREIDLDRRGSRRLRSTEQWVWTLIAGVTFIIAGIYQKFLLNWIVGPIWLVAWVVVGPVLWDRIRRGRRSSR